MRRCPFCAELIKTAAHKCKHCRSMLPVSAPRPVSAPPNRPTDIGPTQQGVPPWVLPLVVGLIVAGATFAASSSSLLFGALIVAFMPLVVAVVAIGRFASAPPTALQTISRTVLGYRWWSLAVAVALLAGAIPGIGARQEAVSSCEDARAHALGLERNGADPDALVGPFSRAADACGEAGLEDERAEMAGASADASETARRQTLEKENDARRASYKAAITAARKLAADPKQLAAAAEKFSVASSLGDLSAADRATFAELHRREGERLVRDKKFRQALEHLETAQRISEPSDELDALVAEIKVEARGEQVRAWIDRADAVSRDKTACKTGKNVSDAWAGLKQVTKDDHSHRKAAATARRLERCRRRLEREFTKTGRAVRKMQREGWASEYETKLLDQGMDVRVRLRGRYKDTVKIIYVLFNRAWAHKITDGGSTASGSFLGELETLGFKRVIFSDGFYESYSYDLDPEDERTMGQLSLRQMGLGQPLEL